MNFVVLGGSAIAVAIGLQLGVGPSRWGALGPAHRQIAGHHRPAGSGRTPAIDLLIDPRLPIAELADPILAVCVDGLRRRVDA